MNNLLRLLPNEHLRSFLFRIHSHSSPFGTFATTAKRYGVHNYKTSPITSLQTLDYQLASLVSKTPLDIWKHNASGNLMMPFMTPQELAETENCFSGVEFQLDAIHAYTLHNVNWRFCPTCAEEDSDLYGISYYHQRHQIPGVFHCYKHGEPLISGCKSCGFELKDTTRICVPPTDSKCPSCGSGMTPDIGYFDDFMRVIECESLKINRGNHNYSLISVQAKNLENIGFKEGETDSLAFKRACTNWYRDLAENIGPNALKRYFNKTKETNGITTSLTMRTTRLFLSSSTNRFSPPLIYLLALHGATNT
ncbi:TniQ family protein [Vibrio parahaemolyticus]|uniref:TniQ family protein n=1 Tax=Vibrio vulnificus TaxID=672 RepID=UPI001A1EB1E5|nr:TniQ family protein [Vibrio vulnificus]MCU8313744.1 TniQ family protein [Vibrio vulnificus]HAS6217986.1 hypothetical protein [Vibrio vulnificus]HCG7662210.1 TniQ family protein [Vibrio parahaemolyticus]